MLEKIGFVWEAPRGGYRRQGKQSSPSDLLKLKTKAQKPRHAAFVATLEAPRKKRRMPWSGQQPVPLAPFSAAIESPSPSAPQQATALYPAQQQQQSSSPTMMNHLASLLPRSFSAPPSLKKDTQTLVVPGGNTPSFQNPWPLSVPFQDVSSALIHGAAMVPASQLSFSYPLPSSNKNLSTPTAPSAPNTNPLMWMHQPTEPVPTNASLPAVGGGEFTPIHYWVRGLASGSNSTAASFTTKAPMTTAVADDTRARQFLMEQQQRLTSERMYENLSSMASNQPLSTSTGAVDCSVSLDKQVSAAAPPEMENSSGGIFDDAEEDFGGVTDELTSFYLNQSRSSLKK